MIITKETDDAQITLLGHEFIEQHTYSHCTKCLKTWEDIIRGNLKCTPKKETVEQPEIPYKCQNCGKEGTTYTKINLAEFKTGILRCVCECGLITTFDRNNVKKIDNQPGHRTGIVTDDIDKI